VLDAHNNDHNVFVHPFVRPDHWEIADLWAANWNGMPDIQPFARYDWLFDHIESLHENGARTFCALNRRTGAGVAAALLDQCKSAGGENLRVTLDAGNARALGFFLREGFVAQTAGGGDDLIWRRD